MTTPASGSNETDPAPGAPLSRGVVRRGWASRCRASLFSFRLPGTSRPRPKVPLPSEAAGPSRQRQKWRAYTGGHSERRPSNGACTRANVRQQPRSGFKAAGPVAVRAGAGATLSDEPGTRRTGKCFILAFSFLPFTRVKLSRRYRKPT